MPDLHRIDNLIAKCLGRDSVHQWSYNTDLSFDLLTRYNIWSIYHTPSGYRCELGHSVWDGQSYPTLALAVCGAILAQHGISIKD
jgi:hypothetical protein